MSVWPYANLTKWLDWSVSSANRLQLFGLFFFNDKKSTKIAFLTFLFLVENFVIHPLNFTVNGFIISPHDQCEVQYPGSNNTGVFLHWCIIPSRHLFCSQMFWHALAQLKPVWHPKSWLKLFILIPLWNRPGRQSRVHDTNIRNSTLDNKINFLEGKQKKSFTAFLDIAHCCDNNVLKARDICSLDF